MGVTITALHMLLHNRTRLMLTTGGVAVAFFLVLAQTGLLVGWVHTCTGIVRHANVDLWVMAEQAPAFDYGTAIPRQRIYETRSVPGVEWAQGMFIAWNIWHRRDGRRVNVQLVGLNDAHVGGPWKLVDGRLDCVERPNTVIVDKLYQSALGFQTIGEEFEMLGKRARIGAVSFGVRTLSACPFVFTSLKQAIDYDGRYRSDEITYVLVRCTPGVDVAAVQQEMRRRISHVEVLTTWEFALRTALYWMLETGVGITVLVTGALGVVVSIAITSQTLYAITQENLGNYATLLALGFHRARLVFMVLVQSLILGSAGVVGGSAMFFPAVSLSSATPIPLETTPAVYAGLVVLSLVSCGVASVMSVRSVFRIDPVTVFRG